MFNIFNIGITPKEPVLVQNPVKIAKPRAVVAKKVEPAKPDLLKGLETILSDLQYVNNPRVDSLRKLYLTLENGGNLNDVVAFCKVPTRKIKASKKPKY